MKLIKLIDQVFCAHWFWKRHPYKRETIVCTLCGKIKPINKLKKKEKLLTNWWQT